MIWLLMVIMKWVRLIPLHFKYIILKYCLVKSLNLYRFYTVKMSSVISAKHFHAIISSWLYNL